jgi:hypothetical protein
LIEPTLEECAKEWRDDLIVSKYNVESNNDELKVELLLRGVMPKSLPALILIHNNQILTTWKGVIKPQELQTMLEDQIVLNNVDKKKDITASTKSSSTRNRNNEATPSKRKSGLISFAMMNGNDGDDYMLKTM